MEDEYYPWGGDFTPSNPNGCVAVVILNIKYTPTDKVAIFGPLKTENIGIEKIVANIISNPHIRYIVICGEEIRGHRSGASLIALHKNGIDKQNKIIDAPGAIPYIENINNEAIDRFQKQVEIINLIGINDKENIDNTIEDYTISATPSFGKPYIAIQIKPEVTVSLDDKRVIHSKIVIDYMGRIKKRGE